jgi:hypothetical protein
MEAPAGVVANLARRTSAEGQRQLLLHLVNCTGTMHETSYLVDWVPELRDIPVRNRLAARDVPAAVSLLTTGQRLAFAWDGQVLGLRCPHLHLHDTVVVDLA